jgi:hypothetical protein
MHEFIYCSTYYKDVRVGVEDFRMLTYSCDTSPLSPKSPRHCVTRRVTKCLSRLSDT